MSETQFILFENITAGIAVFLEAACLDAFYYPFMTGRKEQRIGIFKKALIVFAAYAAIFSAKELFSIYGWLCIVIVIILLAAASGFLGMDKKISFYLCIMFFCMRTLSGLIVESLFFTANDYWISQAREIEVIFRNMAVSYGCYVSARIILCCFMLFFVGKRLGKGKPEPEMRELCYLSILPVTGMLFGNIIYKMMLVIKDGTFFVLYEQYPVFLGLVPLICVLFYVGIFSNIVSYQEMIKQQEEKKKYFVEEQQVRAVRERMEDVEQFYGGIRQMRHEMRNHLTNIKGLAESGSYEDVKQYIAKMDESMNLFELTIQTGNAVTDVIVNDKQKAAVKQGIEFQSEFTYPASDKYNAYDIGIIINNLLQNALEACEKMAEKKRCISLSGRQKKKFFLIEVRNTFEGEVAFDKNTKLPISTKGKGTSLHGIGLSNVKREVEKYMGDIDIKIKKNEFRVTVLLQERRSGE